MWFAVSAALASDSGIQLLYDRQITCALSVDPPAEAATCEVRVHSRPPVAERPTWAIAVAPPGKLFVSMHMPAIDWGDVRRLGVNRAFDPVLLTLGVADAEVCPGEKLYFAHLNSERGNETEQVCTAPPWPGEAEILLESHRKLTPDAWTPIWAWKPTDPTLAADVKNWFFAQVRISTDGTAPERPPQHPYVSVDVLRAWVPKPLPPVRRLEILGPAEEPPAP